MSYLQRLEGDSHENLVHHWRVTRSRIGVGEGGPGQRRHRHRHSAQRGSRSRLTREAAHPAARSHRERQRRSGRVASLCTRGPHRRHRQQCGAMACSARSSRQPTRRCDGCSRSMCSARSMSFAPRFRSCGRRAPAISSMSRRLPDARRALEPDSIPQPNMRCEGLSVSLAQEVAPLGIKVTAVAPGAFRTDFCRATRSARAKPKTLAYEASGRPHAPRLSTPWLKQATR